MTDPVTYLCPTHLHTVARAPTEATCDLCASNTHPADTVTIPRKEYARLFQLALVSYAWSMSGENAAIANVLKRIALRYAVETGLGIQANDESDKSCPSRPAERNTDD